MTSKPGKQTIAIDILPNFSRSKRYQTIKFGYLIKHDTRNIFWKNYTQNMEKLRRPFSKKLKFSISLDQLSQVLYSWFLLHPKLKAHIKLF